MEVMDKGMLVEVNPSSGDLNRQIPAQYVIVCQKTWDGLHCGRGPCQIVGLVLMEVAIRLREGSSGENVDLGPQPGQVAAKSQRLRLR